MIQGPLPKGVALLEDERFVRECVAPLVASGATTDSRGPAFRTRMHARRGIRSRAVAEYSFGGRSHVVAKLYLDVAEGRTAYQIHSRLWRDGGFGGGSPYRVPEPIAYLAEHGVVLMRAAPGGPLCSVEQRDRQAFEEGLRGAARWLAALHASPLRLGPRQEVAHEVARLARRAATATACRPDLERAFRRAMEELDARRPAHPDLGPPVQTHGRYHAEHVFLRPEFVTVIDLDRSAVSDAAKDVGEFLHRLRWLGGQVAMGRPCSEGVEPHVPQRVRSAQPGSSVGPDVLVVAQHPVDAARVGM